MNIIHGRLPGRDSHQRTQNGIVDIMAQCRVQNQVWDQVGEQVANQVWDQVKKQIRDKIGDQSEDLVGPVWNLIQDQGWAQVRAQLKERDETA